MHIENKSIVVVVAMAMLFLGCQDTYKRVGNEATKQIFPQGIAKNFEITYTESPEKINSENTGASKVMAVMSGPLRNDYENLDFPYQTFPEGVVIEIFNEKGQKTTIEADTGILYAATGLVSLEGNVRIDGHDGKKLKTPQLYYDRGNEWAFTEKKFTFTNPEDGTVMDGEGMDIKKDLSFLNAHKTYGLMLIKESQDD
ncbi:LPS export ABC transporter periplasmic protein LptC [Maribacter sp. 2307ULW6-5]|uniref:LPS export ABC transporter periplasmic protein LptC n=1 Tax=Maribacter sp. 2307ULW6-5 TaxID=3386275 RepID=UPI0039BD6A6E